MIYLESSRQELPEYIYILLFCLNFFCLGGFSEVYPIFLKHRKLFFIIALFKIFNLATFFLKLANKN